MKTGREKLRKKKEISSNISMTPGFKFEKGDCSACQGCAEPSLCLNMNNLVRSMGITCYDILGEDMIIKSFPDAKYLNGNLTLILSEVRTRRSVNDGQCQATKAR